MCILPEEPGMMCDKKQDGAEATEQALPREKNSMKTLKTIGWISVGLGAVAAGLIAGRELQKRYNFNRRTPYDYYAHAGDEIDMEYSVGV
jgi:hypothetical protein